MMFLLRAAFWMGVVSLFVPAGFAGMGTDAPASGSAPATLESLIAAGEESGFCRDAPLVCDVAVHAGRFGELFVDIAATRIESWLEAQSQPENPDDA